MLKHKGLRKLNSRFYNPTGKYRWYEYMYANAVRNIIISEVEAESDINDGYVTITEVDASFIALVASKIKAGNPSYNPFSGGRAFGNTTMTVIVRDIKTALGIY